MSLISSLIIIFNIYNSLPKRKMAEVITYHIKSVGLLYYFTILAMFLSTKDGSTKCYVRTVRYASIFA